MNTLQSLEKSLRPLQSLDDRGFHPRYLFRGQRRHHGSITPLISRRPCKEAVHQLYQLFLDARVFATGIGGYSVDSRDGIGLLQHYGLPTPFIDFTGTLDVAMFFALLGAKPEDQAVIYVLDRAQLPPAAISFELDFLCLPLSQGGARHRHMRQDAFVVGPTDWRSPASLDGLDLLVSPFAAAIETHLFLVKHQDRADIADIMSLENDPIPRHLVNLIRLWAEQRISEPLHKDIRECLQEMLSYRGGPPNTYEAPGGQGVNVP